MCMYCGRDMQIDMILTDARGSRRFCPNHAIQALFEGKLNFKPNMKAKEEVHGELGAVKFSSPYSGEEYILAPATMRRLLNHSLYKTEYRAIVRNLIKQGKVKNYNELPYMIHDDFYFPTGEAWQPAMSNAKLNKLYNK